MIRILTAGPGRILKQAILNPLALTLLVLVALAAIFTATRLYVARPSQLTVAIHVTVVPPGILRIGHPAPFEVAVSTQWPGMFYGNQTTMYGSMIELELPAGWRKPRIEPAAPQSCEDISPGIRRTDRPTYWRLSFGDCSAVALILTPVSAGTHRFTLHPFAMTLDTHGKPQSSPVEEPRFAYRWSDSHIGSPIPGCVSSDLRASADWQGEAQMRTGGLMLSSRGDAVCRLRGLPRLALYSYGQRLAVRERPVAASGGSSRRAVIVRPGRPAGIQFDWQNWCGRPADLLRVSLPPDRGHLSTYIRWGRAARSAAAPPCMDSSRSSTIAVWSIRSVTLVDPLP